MSYILDALRKSSEERQKVQHEKEAPFDFPPAPYTLAPDTRKIVRKPLLLSFFAVFAVCLPTAAFYYYHFLKQPPHTPLKLAAPFSRESLQPTDNGNTVATQLDTDASDSAQPAVTTSSVQAETAEQQARDTVPAPAEPKRVRHAEFDAIPLLEELPLTTQAAIPEMKFNGHVYSPTPRLRLIMVNNVVVREGDLITPEIRLQHITETGLIFAYRGTPFRIKLF